MKKIILFVIAVCLIANMQTSSGFAGGYTAHMVVNSPTYGEEDVAITAKGVQTCINITVPTGCVVNVTFQWYNYSGGDYGVWTNYGNISLVSHTQDICFWNANVSCATENWWSEYFHWRVVANFTCPGGDYQEILYSYFNPEDCPRFRYIYPNFNESVCPCCSSICLGINNTNGNPMNLTFYGSYDEEHYFIWNKYYNVSNGTYCFCMDSVYLEPSADKQGEWVGASGIQAAGTKPATLAKHGCGISWEFADNLEKEVQFTVRIPQRMNLSYPVTLDIGWSSPTADRVCNWNLTYSTTALDEDTYVACEYYQDVLAWSSATVDGLVMYRYYIDEIADDDRCIHFSLQRDGNDLTDNLSDVANLHGICFSYYLDNDLIHVENATSPMRYNTTYYWYVNVSDTVTGEYNESDIYYFTTAEDIADCPCYGNSSMSDVQVEQIATGIGVVGLIGIIGILGFIENRRKRRNKLE